MKRIIALLLCFTFIITGCSFRADEGKDNTDNVNSLSVYDGFIRDTSFGDTITGLDDSNLPSYLEDELYIELVDQIGDDYIVQSIDTTYVSQEYIEELIYNSQENVYFGYQLSDLDAQFEGTRYLFTCNDEGETEVCEYKIIEDSSRDYSDILRNIAIGSGVILVCVTVAAIAYPTAPVVSAVMAVGAQKGVEWGLCGGLLSGTVAGITTAIRTGDLDEALYSFAEAGSEGFMVGAISGCLFGGVSEFAGLKAATSGGLSIDDVARIQLESHYPLELISRFHSIQEYELFYEQTGLTGMEVNGRIALVRDIDLDYVGIDSRYNANGLTNYERMMEGLTPYDPATGEIYNLHHIGQEMDSPLAILTSRTEHSGNYSILHQDYGPNSHSQIDRPVFEKERREFWQSYVAELVA